MNEGNNGKLRAPLHLVRSMLQAEKVEAQQQAEDCRAQMVMMQADMHTLRLQLAQAAARPSLPPAQPLPQPHFSPSKLLCHPLQSVLGRAGTLQWSLHMPHACTADCLQPHKGGS